MRHASNGSPCLPFSIGDKHAGHTAERNAFSKVDAFATNTALFGG